MGGANSTEAKPGVAELESQEALLDAPASRPSALVICGPSGVGKGTLIEHLTTSKEKFGFSCSHTTRAPRPGEVDGKDYFFTSRESFERGIEAGEFLEYAEVHNNIYGTSFKAVEEVAASGRSCVLDIDVQGVRLVRASKLRAVFVFIAPPSIEELEQRLRGRGTESEDQIKHRLTAAEKELESVHEQGLFDYLLINDDLESAFANLEQVANRALAGQVGNSSPDGGLVALTASQQADSGIKRGDEEEASKSQAHLSASGTAMPQTAPSAGAETSSPKQPAGIERWKGKVALVTGASAGIGWAISQRLALEGLRVVAVARRRERLEALQQHLVAAGVPIADFLPVVCDITKEAEVVALPRIIVKRWPGAGIDILVNNAGMARNNAALFDGRTSTWVEMISTNVLGPCMCTREALQDMKRREQWGHIININSMAGHRIAAAATNGSAFYSATKAALKMLTEGLRQEARGRQVPLRVSQISPGMVETEFSLVMSYGDEAAAKKRYSDMQCLQPNDVADAVIWAISAPDHVDVHDVLLRPVDQHL